MLRNICLILATELLSYWISFLLSFLQFKSIFNCRTLLHIVVLLSTLYPWIFLSDKIIKDVFCLSSLSFLYSFFWLRHTAYRILVPQPGSEPRPQ